MDRKYDYYVLFAYSLETVGIDNPRDQAVFNACFQIFNLIIAVSTASQAEHLGRRELFLASSIGMLITYSIATALNATYVPTKSSAASRGFIVFYSFSICLTISCYRLWQSPILLKFYHTVYDQKEWLSEFRYWLPH